MFLNRATCRLIEQPPGLRHLLKQMISARSDRQAESVDSPERNLQQDVIMAGRRFYLLTLCFHGERATGSHPSRIKRVILSRRYEQNLDDVPEHIR